MSSTIGVVGLGVMGANLARNIESRGFKVAGYDLDVAKTLAFVKAGAEHGATGVDSPDALMLELERPRRILMMVPAGAAVDAVIQHLLPHLAPGDILIDGGNSFFRDTDRRFDELAARRIEFLGTGVSGGEEGALRGPAIMPGGSPQAWEAVAPILRAIAARAKEAFGIELNRDATSKLIAKHGRAKPGRRRRLWGPKHGPRRRAGSTHHPAPGP